MPAKIQQYPVYVYDEPATYNNFMGGINTDPSNEHLLENEMRDCVNMHYLSGALVKRKGAKEVAKLICDTDLFNIQGVFLFTYKITYIIVAADGKLYYGVFNENTDIHLERLYIQVHLDQSSYVYNPQNLFVGLEEHYEELVDRRHEGFIHSCEMVEGKPVNYKYIGDYMHFTRIRFYPGEVVTFNYTKYKCVEEHDYALITPESNALWKEETYEEAYKYWIEFLTTHPENSTTITEEEATDPTKSSIPDWQPTSQEWVKGYVVKYNHKTKGGFDYEHRQNFSRINSKGLRSQG
jgi:hypothetical protein